MITVIVVIGVEWCCAARCYRIDRIANSRIAAQICATGFKLNVMISVRRDRDATGDIDIALLRRATDDAVFLTLKTATPKLYTNQIRYERPGHIVRTLSRIAELRVLLHRGVEAQRAAPLV